MALGWQLFEQLPFFQLFDYVGEPMNNQNTNIPALGGINQAEFTKSIVKLEELAAFSLMEGLLIGVDISSKVDYIYGFDAQGIEIKHACKCEELMESLDKKFDGAKLTVCIENCTGASALSEQLQRAGHNCVLMPTDFCVEFNQGNKDDCNDPLPNCVR